MRLRSGALQPRTGFPRETCAIDPDPCTTRLAQLFRHGGALAAAQRLFPDAPTPWIDLSTGINPHAYPVGLIPSVAWERLPEAEPLAALEAEAARRYAAAASVGVVAAPGTQAIIQGLPELLTGRDVRILGRTYGEFARTFDATAGVRSVAGLADLAGADVAVVVNPNNPDGRFLAPEALAALSPRVGGLIVDEAFVDALEPACSLVPYLPLPRTIVLRSFGKFYGLAGLRLGFALATPELASPLRERLGPWAVGGPALTIGSRALADAPWLEASRRRLASEAARLDGVLAGAGLSIVGGTPLFRLATHPCASTLFEVLARKGILPRPFADRPDWLRFGIPPDPKAWARLERALTRWTEARSD